MSFLCPGGRRAGGEGASVDIEVSVPSCFLCAIQLILTFVSTNLLIVARISWCPDTSSRDAGRYFSILEGVSKINVFHIADILYHGSASSASTGRLAALLFPFEASELNITESLAAGASTSISSSKSDILSLLLCGQSSQEILRSFFELSKS